MNILARATVMAFCITTLSCMERPFGIFDGQYPSDLGLFAAAMAASAQQQAVHIPPMRHHEKLFKIKGGIKKIARRKTLQCRYCDQKMLTRKEWQEHFNRTHNGGSNTD